MRKAILITLNQNFTFYPAHRAATPRQLSLFSPQSKLIFINEIMLIFFLIEI